MKKLKHLQVTYKSTSDFKTLYDWLHSLPRVVALDFETASKFTPAEKIEFKEVLKETTGREQIRLLRQKINSDGLSHPTLAKLTHLSIATSSSNGYVVIIDNEKVRKLVLQWLVSTTRLQLWHNASFDFKHIYYGTGKFPKHYEDTQQLAKSIVNHVDVWRANTRLKDLMGYAYGAWAVSPDMFTTENLYNEDLLLYACTDACATYKLWEDIQKDIAKGKDRV